MSNERSGQRDSVTSSEDDVRGLFDFGPDIASPVTGPQAVLPPWMTEPFAGQTLSARLAAPATVQGTSVGPVSTEVATPDATPAATPVVAEVGTELVTEAEDATPEPVVVPEFARIVPAPRKRRKPVPADRVVIAAPAVVDGSGNVVMAAADTLTDSRPETRPGNQPDTSSAATVDGTVLAPAPLVPAQRGEGRTPGNDDEVPVPARRRRRRWVGLTQAAAIVAVGASVGIYAAGGLSFLENRTKANPPTAEASAWVLNNLAGAGSVLIPSSMADTLIQNGQDSDALTTYADNSTAPLDLGKNCCSFLVLAGAPGQAPGTELPESVQTLFERSRPAAVFTTDGGWTQVRQVLPGTPAKVAADLKSDHAALVATGKSLIASGRVDLSDVAKSQLQNGEVDARVLLGVVAVALQHKITIASFPAQPGEADAGILRRSVAVSKIDGKVVKDGSNGVKSVKDLLARQTGLYRPAGAAVHPVDGVTALEIRFDAPSPFGLLTLTDESGKR